MYVSEYFDRIRKMVDAGLLHIRGNTLVLELLPEPEVKTAGGLIIASDRNQLRGGIKDSMMVTALVCAVGEGYYQDDGSTIPVDTPVGSVVMAPPYAVRRYSMFPGFTEPTYERIGSISESEVTIWLKSIEDLNEAEKLTKA